MNGVHQGAELRTWITEPLPPDVAKSLRKIAAADDVRHVAVMPDVHLAEEVCIGAVVATSEVIYPAAVGGDIGCGMAAVRTTADARLIQDETSAARLFDGLYRRVPTNRHSALSAPTSLPTELMELPLSDARLDKLKGRDGRVQLGTLGRGNHFLEFQADQQDRLWVMVHSGSRAMGHAITAHHVKRAGRSSEKLTRFDCHAEEGRDYLADAAWAQQYAARNRLAMLAAVEALVNELFGIDMDWSTLVHTDHNHVRREIHGGEAFWVHRKGAQSAREYEPGIIPGSMGTSSFHVMGRGCSESLCSSSHGAGRRMSRSKARCAIGLRQFSGQMKSVWYDHRRGQALRDEAPGAYKDIHAVMRAQKELTRIARELRPVLSYKGT